MRLEDRATAELNRVLAEARASTEGGITAFGTYWNRRSLIARTEKELSHRAAAAPQPPPPKPAPAAPEEPALDDEQVPGDDDDIRELQEALMQQYTAVERQPFDGSRFV